jgi:hypothetical protein
MQIDVSVCRTVCFVQIQKLNAILNICLQISGLLRDGSFDEESHFGPSLCKDDRIC